MWFSVGTGIRFNNESKEASVCINLKIYVNHSYMARLLICRMYIYIYTYIYRYTYIYIYISPQVNMQKWWQNSRKYFALLYAVLSAFVSSSLLKIIGRRVTTVILEKYETVILFKFFTGPKDVSLCSRTLGIRVTHHGLQLPPSPFLRMDISRVIYLHALRRCLTTTGKRKWNSYSISLRLEVWGCVCFSYRAVKDASSLVSVMYWVTQFVKYDKYLWRWMSDKKKMWIQKPVFWL